MTRDWVRLTKRTDDPKLGWLERQFDDAGITHRRNGFSFHAPILEVRATDAARAWGILAPVDDIPDDDPRFGPSDDEEQIGYKRPDGRLYCLRCFEELPKPTEATPVPTNNPIPDADLVCCNCGEWLLSPENV